MADFGAFVELEPGIEGLAHASTFAATGRAGEWKKSVAVGLTGAFEILSIDPAQKRIGVALVDEGSSRAAAATATQDAIVTGAIDAATPDAEPTPSMGSIADKLRGALGKQ